MDYSFTDYYHSQHFFKNFSDNNVTHLSLDQPFEAFHQQYSCNSKSKHFDKHCRKRSFRRGRWSDRPHPLQYSIDLSSRNVTHTEGINVLSKGPSFYSIPRYINWHKCPLDWQAFVDKVRWAVFYFDCEPTHNSNTSVILPNDLGPSNIESYVRAPVSKDIALIYTYIYLLSSS